MSAESRDTLVFRLAQILVKLNQGAKLNPHELAIEFGVNLRTIQRDLNDRFAYLPLEKVDGVYRLDPRYLGKLNTKDVERFASLAGVRGLFPAFSEDFLRDIFDSRVQTALLVRGHQYESLAGKESTFRDLETAIVSRRQVAFAYDKPEGAKAVSAVNPYKLLNHNGIWYLAAVDDGSLKTFAFGRIGQLAVLDRTYTPDARVESQILEEEGIWLGDRSGSTQLDRDCRIVSG